MRNPHLPHGYVHGAIRRIRAMLEGTPNSTILATEGIRATHWRAFLLRNLGTLEPTSAQLFTKLQQLEARLAYQDPYHRLEAPPRHNALGHAIGRFTAHEDTLICHMLTFTTNLAEIARALNRNPAAVQKRVLWMERQESNAKAKESPDKEAPTF